jgi:hypothetical protein
MSFHLAHLFARRHATSSSEASVVRRLDETEQSPPSVPFQEENQQWPRQEACCQVKVCVDGQARLCSHCRRTTRRRLTSEAESQLAKMGRASQGCIQGHGRLEAKCVKTCSPRGIYLSDFLHRSTVHRPNATKVDNILRVFDQTPDYGPCVGMTRLERWERADALGLSPPDFVRALSLFKPLRSI